MAQRNGSPKDAAPTERVRAVKERVAVSPEQTSAGFVFRLFLPTARDVQLALGFPYAVYHPMRRDDEGEWSTEPISLTPDVHGYMFAVDGAFMADPGNADTDTRINGASSLLDVPALSPAGAEAAGIEAGVLHRHRYRSQVLGRDKALWVYTPPRYDAAQRYPVLYLRHGATQTERSWVHGGRADRTLDELIGNGTARPMLVAMTDGYVDAPSAGQLSQTRNTTHSFELLGRELVEEVVPLVDRSYATVRDARHRALAGLSMGAGQSFVLGLRNPETFATVGAFSSGVVSAPEFDFETWLPGFLATGAESNASRALLWLSCGDRDRRLPGHRRVVATLAEHGIEHEFEVVPGAHEWPAWRSALARFATRVFA